MGRAARDGRPHRRRPARARRRARRPRGRLHAEHPRGGRRLPGDRVDRGGVVELLARLRSALGDRPLRPDRAEGAAGGRRLPLQRPRLRPPRGRRRDRRRGRRAPRAARLPRRLRLGGRLRAARRPGVRARAVRPPPVGPLLVRHHGAAEGDRPGPGRDPARAPQEAPPARRRPGRRPRLLVHDDRLDDVELPRLRPAHRGRDRALRRQPRPAGHERAVGPRRPRRHHLLRHQRGVHRRLHEGGGRAGERPRPVEAAGGRLDRLAAVAGRLPLGVRPRRRGHVAVLDQRRHRPVHGVRRRRPDPARLRGRAAGALARRVGRGVGPRGAPADRRRWASW